MSISTEQASRIEAKLDQLVGDVSTVKSDVSTLKTDVSTLKTDVSTLKTEVVDLRVHMGVLHEAAIDQIKLVAEGQQALREQIGRDFTALRKEIDDRIRPLEDTVREHSALLKRQR
jgi:predicted  nucleic acid-binding Zn-ribbon protein